MSWVTRQVIGKKNLKEVSLKQRWEKYKNKNLSRNFSFISKHMRMGENYMAIIRKKKKRTVVVGKVCFTSERIVVADPAYEVDSRYVVCLNIIPGEYTYYAKIKQEGKSEFV